jgi:lipopolysaccharide transport system permease protein
MSPGGHLVTTAIACALVYAGTGSAALTAGLAAGGFLIDVDHVFDYVVFEGQRDLRPSAFMKYTVDGRRDHPNEREPAPGESSMMSQSSYRARPRVRRQAHSGWAPVDWSELWHYRELLLFYAKRDLTVRYKQTLLGVLWAVLQPGLTMVVFSIFFGRLAGVPSNGVPYPVFALCALLPWQLFAYALTQSSNSLVQDAQVLTKVYFPRLLLPLASVLAGLIDFALAFALLAVMMFAYGVAANVPAVVALPAFMLLAIISALAVGIGLSALNVKYRDVRYAIPFLTQLWLFATPVAYPSSIVPASWLPLYALNPMVCVVDGFRWALLGQAAPPLSMIAISTLAASALLVGSVYYFTRSARQFADVI